jgi:predicted DNA-binding protein (MmcQ/YjbR family)
MVNAWRSGSPQIDKRQLEIENHHRSPTVFMNIESLRRFCLAFPYTTEDMPWPDDLCFKVGGKIFAGVSLGTVPQGISLKCTPEKFAELVEQEGIGPAPYVGRYKWVRIEELNLLPDAELKNLIQQSYEMVAAGTRPAKRRLRAKPKRAKRNG